MESIDNTSLDNKQYTEDILISNIHKLSMHSILTTQSNLSYDFMNNYVLNSKYHTFREDFDITLNEIKIYQPQYFIDYNNRHKNN